MSKRYAVWMLILIIPFVLAGCGGEEQKTKKSAPNTVTNGDDPPKPPSGSPIVLKPKNPGEGSNAALFWYAGTDEQMPGNSILDPAKTDDYCKLRDDFIGQGIDHFRFTWDDNGQKNPATTVTLKNATHKLTITYQSDKQPLLWNIEAANGSPLCAGGIQPDSTKRDNGKVPLELMGFTLDKLSEASDPDKAAKLHELQVNWPDE